MLLGIVDMLKKKLGIEAIEVERDWGGIGVKSIESYFKISSILAIPEGCRSIGFAVFMSCNKILKKVIIPGSVERIEDWAFGGCPVANIILHKPWSKFEFIATNAFLGCRNVKEEIRC